MHFSSFVYSMTSSIFIRSVKIVLPGKHLRLSSLRFNTSQFHLEKPFNYSIFVAKMPKRKVTQKSITSYVESKKNNDDESSDNDSDAKEEEPKRATKKAKNEDSGRGDQPVKAAGKAGGKPMNKTSTDYDDIKFECEKKSPDGKEWNFKISSWNIVSLKSVVAKSGMEFLKHESPDIMCFSETKCGEKDIPEEAKVDGYHRYFVSSEKKGYAGVALYTKEKPIKVEYGIGNKEFDNEGRLITAEYEKFYLVATYVPNAGQGLKTLPKRMKWDEIFREYLKKLDAEKPVILTGDLNVAHNEIDLKNPKTNTKSAGFTKEERDNFTALLDEGFVDTFRHLYPDKEGAYTYWNYIGNARSRNTGWRLDYFVVSKRLLSNVCDNIIRNEVYGSDHCPVTLFLSL